MSNTSDFKGFRNFDSEAKSFFRLKRNKKEKENDWLSTR